MNPAHELLDPTTSALVKSPNRRSILSYAGASAAALAAPALFLPGEAQALTTAPLLPGVPLLPPVALLPTAPVPAHTGLRSVNFKYYAENVLNTNHNIWIATDLSFSSDSFFITDQNFYYHVSEQIYTDSTIFNIWRRVATEDSNSSVLIKSWDSRNRVLASTASAPSGLPWVLSAALGATIIAQSSIVIRRHAGWIRFRQPVGGGTVGFREVAKYWVFDTTIKAWHVRSQVLINENGVVNPEANTFHQSFVATSTLFTNNLFGLLQQTAGSLIASVVIAQGIVDLTVSRFTPVVLGAIGAVGVAGFAYLSSCANYSQALYSQILSKAGIGLVHGEYGGDLGDL